ncbi:MAG TPA: SMI1/KNR4 family protein, partial [Egibacteraceae bacterium]|nr:SMI1/KNR4 family protein [Egibacteraceae bacterium]
SEAIERARLRIQEHRERCHFVGPRDEAVVREAERALDVRFPPSYRTFVLAFGAGSAGSEEFYGVVEPDFSGPVPDAVWVTLQERQGPAGLPQTMVAIGHDGMGGTYVMDTAKGEEPPVEVWQGGASRPGDDLERIAADFGAFFLHQVSQGLQPP